MVKNQDIESTEAIVEKQTNVATIILNSFKTNKKHLCTGMNLNKKNEMYNIIPLYSLLIEKLNN